MRITAVVALFADLPEAELTSWVVRGWVRPERSEADQGGGGPGGGGQGAGSPGAGSPGDSAPGDAAQGGGWDFHEIDVARVRLIHDLHRSMDISEETMPVVLSLLDQVYELRGTLRELLRALDTQPEDVRAAVLAPLRPWPRDA